MAAPKNVSNQTWIAMGIAIFLSIVLIKIAVYQSVKQPGSSGFSDTAKAIFF